MNKVELLGSYGGDESHALSAWTSTSRELNEDKRARMGDLLKMLAAKGHMTPFEKSALHFLVTCDTASHIHLIKHRIGVSINAESARYKELKEDKYHIPTDWPEDVQQLVELEIKSLFESYHTLVAGLVKRGIDRKRAKESARFILPYANQVTMDVMFNWRSFAHFLGLRNKPEAQLEIREIAKEMLRLVKETGQFNQTIKAFTEAGLIGE